MDDEVVEALKDLASGRHQRTRHDLRLGGRDLSAAFEEVLRREGFVPLRVRDLRLAPGLRHPAWVLRDGEAHFGHVFLEKFDEVSRRPLFGSVVRDWRGDWAVMITRSSRETVWVRTSEAQPFDEDRPSGGV
ncbi:MAG: hypothetical protein AB1347_08885 [Acidobacteriota bacterium]